MRCVALTAVSLCLPLARTKATGEVKFNDAQKMQEVLSPETKRNRDLEVRQPGPTVL